MPSKAVKNKVSRRGFLKGAAAAVAFPNLVPASALGLNGAVAPSNRVIMASIGVNGMGTADMRAFLGCKDAHVIAVCDVERAHRERAKGIVEEFYGAKGCDMYADFRDVIARQDIDAVNIGTPDHWHVLISIAAAKSGKDIYCEKPLSKRISEGRALCNAIKKYGRVFQTGTQLRSTRNVRYACELVRNGRIGKIHTIRTFVPVGPSMPLQPAQPVPDGLDYNMWLGPAPCEPYTPKRVHFSFRYFSDYAGGTMTDLGAHDNDIAQWGNGTQLTGPVEVEGDGEFPKDGLYDTCMRFKVTYTYQNGVKLICSTDKNPQGTGVRFEGSEGWIYVRSNIDAEPKSVLTSSIGPNEIHLCDSQNHQQNFLDCVKSRGKTIAQEEIGHRSVTVCHLGNIALLLKRKLRWDPLAEQFKNDDEANRMLLSPMRAPWRIT